MIFFAIARRPCAVAGMPLSSSYVLMMFLTVFAGTFAMMHACEKICGDIPASILAGAAYCFANYHITDIYVRSAVGEAMALVFLPVQLEGLYLLFECRDQSGWKPLFIGMTGLLLTHNLTFLLACILTGAFFLIYFSKLPKEIFPEVIPSTAVVGTILPEMADALGLSHDLKVVCGGVDNPVI